MGLQSASNTYILRTKAHTTATHSAVWIGGGSEAALRRAVRLGPAWHSSSRYFETFEDKAAKLRQLAATEKREIPNIQMRTALHLTSERRDSVQEGHLIGTLADVRTSIQDYAAMRIDGFVLDTSMARRGSNIKMPEKYWPPLTVSPKR